ncbi:MAG TPA: hypothetical protein VFX59_27855 [Polyangiales bacterium]|nr:hypothetical protein [Polyangiales bacterium]
MRHVLWLGLALLWASAASAQQPVKLSVHALTHAWALQAPADPTVALTPPCLGCRASLREATAGYAPEPPPQPAAQPTPRAIKPPQYAIGDSWKLGGKRVLSVRLTPTPEECAPLVRLSF